MHSPCTERQSGAVADRGRPENRSVDLSRAAALPAAALLVPAAAVAQSDTTRQWRLRSDAAASLTLIEATLPELEPRDVLVRVRATSLNARDLSMLYGRAPDGIPLSDGAGEVVAVGTGVTRFEPGDRVEDAPAAFEFMRDGDYFREDRDPPLNEPGEVGLRPPQPTALSIRRVNQRLRLIPSLAA